MDKIISFSGIDGSGKSTQISMLKDYFKKNNKNVICYNDLPKTEPLEDISLNEYYQLLNEYDVLVLRSCYRKEDHIDYLKRVKKGNCSLSDTYKLQNFFIRDTYEWFDKIIMPSIKQNKIIVFDRYVYDEMPYQMLFNDDISRIKKFVELLPKPKSFYLKIDVETMINRNANREDSKNSLFSSKNKIQKIIDNYDKVFDNYECIKIDAKKDSRDINRTIIENLELKKRNGKEAYERL